MVEILVNYIFKSANYKYILKYIIIINKVKK